MSKILVNEVQMAYQAEIIKLRERIEELEALLKQHRWILADEPPDNIDLDKKVQVLEHESEIPTIMTMAEVFFDEGSEAEYWKPIILPELSPESERRDMRRKKRKIGKCLRCRVRTTHTEQILPSGDANYKLVFFCLKCTKITPEG